MSEANGHSETERRWKVLVASYYMSLRGIYREILSSSPDIAVVAEASSGEEALRLTEELHPDILVVHPAFFDLDCRKMMENLGRSGEKCPFLVIISDDASPEGVRLWAEAGAKAVVPSSLVPEFLVHAVRRITKGGTLILPGPGAHDPPEPS